MTQDLIARLEAAEEGSRELDAEIARAIKVPETVSDGVQTFPVEPLRYTTSLDAKLPWENIIAAGYDFGMCCWTATHQLPLEPSDDGDPSWVVGHANTEPLARRIAALKARRTA